MTAHVEISENYDFEAIAQAANQPTGRRTIYVDGKLYVDGATQEDLDAAVAAATPIDPIEFEKIKAKVVVDDVAGQARKKYLTTADGQEMTYLKKEADAEAFKAAGYPEVDIADYPWINAEAIAQEDTGQEVADAILAQRDAWITIGAKIEEERMKGKVQINNQLGLDGINTAKNAAIVALKAI